eukprot:4040793-Pyramimonas_sp.AAC.1
MQWLFGGRACGSQNRLSGGTGGASGAGFVPPVSGRGCPRMRARVSFPRRHLAWLSRRRFLLRPTTN